ncbi:filamentous hemagglutinin N-terminal domain-containing protein [Leptolyngbya sp. AN03gr2]|uniref:filamentous hemagglutinin N-terminal domain-containing protein n=1 Tax=unclassified Leptolyngbya TaxID=2650499 RepID=UPI003D318843
MSRALVWLVGWISHALFLASIAQAQQIIPDARLNTQVQISPDGRNFTIVNGTAANQNLFHSFREFSIPTGGSATFDLVNTPNISTIFNRVTGSNLSSIDGTIRTINGSVPTNVFLLNPNGILFGANARLEVSGSFIATSADRVLFADGSSFSATNPDAPLLTISAPVGLQFGQTAEAIRVQETGRTIQVNSIFAPIFPNNPQGLTLSSQQTLALIGGEVVLEGGVLTALTGRIELGAVDRTTTVQLAQTPNGFRFNYAPDTVFRDIRLSRRSLLDASGLGSNGIQIQGRQLSFQDGSFAFISNTGIQAASPIQVRASESIVFGGADPSDRTITSGLWSQTLGQGAGAEISIFAPQLSMVEKSRLASTTFSAATGGTVSITAPKSIVVDGSSSEPTFVRGGVYVSSFRSGKAGSIAVTTPSFTLLNGGQFFSSTFGTGNTGNVTINASDVMLRGYNFATDENSNIGISALNAGNSGKLVINADRVSVFDGASIVGTTLAAGRAGSVTVNARESVLVSGAVRGRDGIISSSIGSSGNIAPTSLQRFLGLTNQKPTGDAGTIAIRTPSLRVMNGASIQVRNQGSGNGGSIDINAGTIRLENQGKILANTASGEGGEIQIRSNVLHLQNNSEITSTAGGTGNGGNIDITSNFVIQRSNSDITANASRGRGGTIQISAQGLLGGAFRKQQTPESDITATSEIGMSGSVTVSSPEVDPNAGLIELSIELIDPNQQVAQGCDVLSDSQFIITGRGGVPENPIEQTTLPRTWVDLREVRRSTIAQVPQAEIVEATGWKRDRTGKVVLVVGNSRSAALPSATCTGFEANR